MPFVDFQVAALDNKDGRMAGVLITASCPQMPTHSGRSRQKRRCVPGIICEIRNFANQRMHLAPLAALKSVKKIVVMMKDGGCCLTDIFF